MELKIIEGFEVATLSYRDVKPLMAKQAAGTLEGDFQDELAGLAVRKDGAPIGPDALLALPFPLAQKLLMAVAEANTVGTEATPEGNA